MFRSEPGRSFIGIFGSDLLCYVSSSGLGPITLSILLERTSNIRCL